MVSATLISIARLCERCVVIEYDRGLASFEQVDGKLDYDAFWTGEKRLDFRLVDRYPDLPLLTESGKTCDFCRLLWEGILSKDASRIIHVFDQDNSPTKIEISELAYAAPGELLGLWAKLKCMVQAAKRARVATNKH